MGLLDGRGLFLGLVLAHSAVRQRLDFALVELVERHIAVADEVVALDAGALRGLPVEEFLPREHRLADVHAAVVDEGGLDDVVASGGEKAGNAVAEEVVADVAEVEGLVGVGRGEFDHHGLPGGGQLPEILRRGDIIEHFGPVKRRKDDVQESLDDIGRRHFGDILPQPGADLSRRLLGAFAGGA